MTNNEIVSELASENVVESIVERITKRKITDNANLCDLCQDIYLSLLFDGKLPGVYDRKETNYYLARIIMNNIASKTSPYYRIYLKYQHLAEEITPKIINIP